MIIAVHLFIILIPLTNISLTIPKPINIIFDCFYNIWKNYFPLLLWEMSNNDNSSHYNILNLSLKCLELTVNFLYFMDLIPKIFVWKKPLIWKLVNICIITLMVIQLPLTYRGYMLSNVGILKLKVRAYSIGLSFLLLIEILSIREFLSIRLKSNFFIFYYKRDSRELIITKKN